MPYDVKKDGTFIYQLPVPRQDTGWGTIYNNAFEVVANYIKQIIDAKGNKADLKSRIDDMENALNAQIAHLDDLITLIQSDKNVPPNTVIDIDYTFNTTNNTLTINSGMFKAFDNRVYEVSSPISASLTSLGLHYVYIDFSSDTIVLSYIAVQTNSPLPINDSVDYQDYGFNKDKIVIVGLYYRPDNNSSSLFKPVARLRRFYASATPSIIHPKDLFTFESNVQFLYTPRFATVRALARPSSYSTEFVEVYNLNAYVYYSFSFNDFLEKFVVDIGQALDYQTVNNQLVINAGVAWKEGALVPEISKSGGIVELELLVYG